jgi:hypothetical protein
MRSLAYFRSNIEKLLNMLPEMMENQPDGNRVAAGSALKGALAGLVRLDVDDGADSSVWSAVKSIYSRKVTDARRSDNIQYRQGT